MSKVSEVLRAARAMVDTPDKWARCSGRPGGKMCVVNAITEATGGICSVGEDANLSKLAKDALCRAAIGGPWQYGVLPDWNDAPERTHPEVMSAFDGAIALAEQEEAHAP